MNNQDQKESTYIRSIDTGVVDSAGSTQIDHHVIKTVDIQSLLKPQHRDSLNNGIFNCLTAELAQLAGVVDTENVSMNSYDPRFEELIINNKDKVFLDVGAGYRATNYPNIVNLEIVAYQSTDVLAIAEDLPFEDNSFDFVHCNAVLEHVKNPFKAAAEMIRVAKPGAKLWISVPFLQPYHGYPNHYYNMTHSGLANLFQGKCQIIEQSVPHYYHPFYALEWFTRQYTWRLSEADKEAFNNLRIGDISKVIEQAQSYGFVANLPTESQLELCSGSLCVAVKN